MANGYDLDVKIDRYDEDYLKLLQQLLQKDSLIKDSQLLQPDDKHHGVLEKKIDVRFCGLSGLSIIGGSENLEPVRQETVNHFIDLISNKNNIVKELNEVHKIYLDVELLFAYPFSDFMYDMIQAEETRQEGISITCQKEKKKYKHDFRTTQRLTERHVQNSKTIQNLYHSLDKIQEAVNVSEGYINSKKKPNRVIVKFCPTNISTCFLKINHNIFLDPYVFSKNKYDSKNLALISPVAKISIPEIPTNLSGLSKNEVKIYEHYCSLMNHFRYLWYHPLTLYSTDATEYRKGENNTLREIKTPKSISYLTKSLHLEAMQKDGVKYTKSSIDLWRQHCKNELLRYCSKFLKSNKDYQTSAQSPGKININPISIFIIGAWDSVGPSGYMNELEAFINNKFSESNVYGLKLNPIKINAENGTEFRKLIFEGLNSSQLAIVVQTSDYPEINNKFSRPNVYIEKGYLMGRLGKKYSRTKDDENHEPVFVFIKEGTDDGSDTNHIAQTRFSNFEYFQLQFFKIVKWLWEITELNSAYAVSILKEYNLQIANLIKNSSGDESRLQILSQFSNLAQEFITQITKWEKDYGERMDNLDSE